MQCSAEPRPLVIPEPMTSDLCRLFQLLDAAHDAQESVNQALEPFGLTQASFQVMYRLQQGSRTNKCLAESTGCARSNITRLVDRLVVQGLVERRPADDDRRVVVTTLTEAGQRRWGEAAAALQSTQDTLVHRMGTLFVDAPMVPERGSSPHDES